MKQTAWIVVGWLLLGSVVQAASFDCGKAGTKVEHLICDNPELSKLDEDLAKSYKAALQDQSKAEQVRQAQKRWMKERNACVDVACVQEAYRKRIGQLHSPQHTAQLAAAPQQATQTNEVTEAACLAPKIDWRNYEWTLITGRGEAICEEMLAYVKSRPSDIAPPTCPDERLPPNGNWTRPETRILGEEEKQSILKNIPERWRQKGPGGPVSYEKQIAGTKLLRVIRGDITRDGIPESFLAFGRNDDYRKTCETSKRCARPEELFKGGIVLVSDSYNLLPMNDEGTQVDWGHKTVRDAPMLMGGELIYYKGLPYWMSGVSWSQNTEDDFTHYSSRPDDPYSAIFNLDMVSAYSRANPQSKDFKVVTDVSPLIADPEDNKVCRFGYFHRDNLKLNPPNKGR